MLRLMVEKFRRLMCRFKLNTSKLNKSEPLVTVIIPIYNTAEFLKKCLDSVVNQTYKNLEILLIDDGSTDNSLEICQVYAKRDKRIKILSHPNQGLSYSRNRGIDNASGEYFYFVDSDDWLSLESIKRQVSIAVDNDADLVLGDIMVYYPNSKPFLIYDAQDSIGRKEITNCYDLISNRWANSVCKLYRRSFVGDRRFEVGVYFEDVVFWPSIFYLAKKIFTTGETEYHYIKGHRCSITNSRPLMSVDNLVWIITAHFLGVKNFIEVAKKDKVCVDLNNPEELRKNNISLWQISAIKSNQKRFIDCLSVFIHYVKEDSFLFMAIDPDKDNHLKEESSDLKFTMYKSFKRYFDLVYPFKDQLDVEAQNVLNEVQRLLEDCPYKQGNEVDLFNDNFDRSLLI